MLIDEKYINKLFDDCCFGENECVSDMLFTPIRHEYYFKKREEPIVLFSTEKLNKNKAEIVRILESFPSNGDNMTLGQFRYQKGGVKWCYDCTALEKFTTLAKATDIITIDSYSLIDNLINVLLINNYEEAYKIGITKNRSNYDTPVSGVKEFLQYSILFASKIADLVNERLEKIFNDPNLSEEEKMAKKNDILSFQIDLVDNNPKNINTVLRLK